MKRFASALLVAATTVSAVNLEATAQTQAEGPLSQAFGNIADTSDRINDSFAELDVNHGGFGGPLRETIASTTGDVLSAVTYVVLTPLMVMDQVSSSLNKFLPGVHDMIDCNLFRNC